MRSAGRILAFETGGTKLVAALAGSDLRIRKSTAIRRASSDRGPESFRRIVAAAERLLDGESGGRNALAAIGFGFGGTVRRSINRPHLCLHEEGWEEVDVVGELERRFGVPVAVENDCKLAGLAEAHFGAGRGAASLFYITLGTGVGGGYIHDGSILACGDLGEAEIGHIVVDPGGLDCCCGGRGCVESVCSGPGLANLCRRFADQFPGEWRSSALPAAVDGRPVRSEDVVRCWERGDRFASRVMEASAGHLATALAAAVNLLVPERIVIGGGLGTSSPRLIELISAQVEPLVVRYFRKSFQIVPSALKEGAVSQGAIILAAQRGGWHRQ